MKLLLCLPKIITLDGFGAAGAQLQASVYSSGIQHLSILLCLLLCSCSSLEHRKAKAVVRILHNNDKTYPVSIPKVLMNRQHLNPPMKVIYLGEGGYPHDREASSKVFEVGKEYVVTGGKMGRESTRYKIEGVEGSWNSALFSGDPFQAPVRYDYYPFN